MGFFFLSFVLKAAQECVCVVTCSNMKQLLDSLFPVCGLSLAALYNVAVKGFKSALLRIYLKEKV